MLPQLRPALLGGMLLVALDVLVEFGAFTLLRFRTFTTELYAEYRTGFDGPDASLLAVVLILLCMLCLVAELRVRGGARYGRVARGTRRQATPYALGWAATIPVLAGFAVLAVVTLGVPLGMILYWLTRHDAAAISPAGVSGPLLLSSTLSSVSLGLGAAALTMALALPLGFLAARYDGRGITLLERAAYLGQGVPGIVVALALVSLTARALQPLYQSALLLIIAYAILFLPLALVSVRAAMRASAAWARGRGAVAGARLGRGRLAGDAADGRAGIRCRRLVGVHLRRDGVDRYTAAGADRHADPGDAGLGRHLDARLRSRRPVCGLDDRAFPTLRVAARAPLRARRAAGRTRARATWLRFASRG